jgi:hypothetical protein
VKEELKKEHIGQKTKVETKYIWARYTKNNVSKKSYLLS